MNIQRMTYNEMSRLSDAGTISADKVEREVTRRASFSLRSVLDRFVSMLNDEGDVYGAVEGNDGRH